MVENVTGIEGDYSVTEVYPNPTNGGIHVKTTAPLKGVAIVDVYGSVRRSDDEHKMAYDLDVTALPTGIYFLRMLQNNGVRTVKVVKE